MMQPLDSITITPSPFLRCLIVTGNRITECQFAGKSRRAQKLPPFQLERQGYVVVCVVSQKLC